MAHKLLFTSWNQIAACSCFLFLMFCANPNAIAGEPEFVKIKENKTFIFTAGFGYGIANNPCRNCDNHKAIGGGTFSLSMGYIINDKIKIEFGPSFWIEGKDLINKNVPDSERPNNKRTIVTFTGSYKPFNYCPLSIKLGAGAGILNFTPEKTTVKTDANKFEETEIFKGFTGTFGLAYDFQLCPKIKMYPSLNFWYIQLQKPQIAYDSYLNYKQAAIMGDIRVNFNYNF